MLTPIKVGEHQLHAYKQPGNWIVPGEYWVFSSPSDAEKKIFELKAAQAPGGRFFWLAPKELWVKRMKDGLLLTEPMLKQEPNWALLGIRPEVLRTWQRDFVTEIWNYMSLRQRYGKGWIARVGAGKTLAGLLAMQMFEPEECLVIVERYLWETWRSQAAEWGFPIPRLSTAESAHKVPPGVKCLIIDEILRLSNPATQRSRKVTEIAKGCELVVGFTGIPMAGKGPMDLRWLRVIDPGSVPSTENAWKFKFGLDTKLAEVGANKAYVTTQWNKNAISEFVAPYIHTVDSEEIIKELPELTYHFIECDQPKQYELIKNGGATTGGVHKKLAQTMQCTDGFVYDDNDKAIRLDSPKMRVLRDLVEDIGEPVIIVTNWSDTVQQLAEMFIDRMPAVVEGGSNYDVDIPRFKNGVTDILIANAGFSKGMNLQAICRNIIFLSPSSKPDNYEQMIGRVHRPGQRLGVNIFHLICKDTLDRRRVELVQKHKGCSEEFVMKLLMEEFLK